ncbi:MAG: hypothetical protein LBV62_01575, partial [Rickettsiales bacterium]|nr:hypothetical protein [Rickettsiales bacterium]
ITNNVDILLLTIAFLNFLMHHFLDKNVLTFSLLFLGKVSYYQDGQSNYINHHTGNEIHHSSLYEHYLSIEQNGNY